MKRAGSAASCATGKRAKAAGGSEKDPFDEARRKARAKVNRELRKLDAPGATARLASLARDWMLDEKELTFEDQALRMFNMFGLDARDNMLGTLDNDEGSYGLRAVDDRINEAEAEAIGLYHRLHELGLLPEKPPPDKQQQPQDGDGGGDDGGSGDEDDAEDALERLEHAEEEDAKRGTLRRILSVLEMVFYAKKVVLSAFQAKLAVHQLHLGESLQLAPDLDARLGSWALRFRYIDNKTTPMQNLLLYLLDGAMEKRYRKSGGWMYEPVYIDGRNTHAWKPVCEIKDFVYSMLHKETCWEQWCNATASGTKNISAAIEYLTHCQDYQLPELHKQRGVYSFRNGVYMAREDRFYAFDGGPPLSEDVVACKFIDDELPCYPEMDWREIPTPSLQSIMDYQQFDPEVCRWMYVMLGRLLYPLNELDSWQVIPFFKGMASSGKSTIILKVCKIFYDAQDVGVLSNNVERKFGLSAFYDKCLFLAPEIKSDLAIEQAEFQSVVSGEDLQVNVKHKKAFATTWAVPGALAGNEVPAWADNSGSVQRRVVLWEFARAVVNGDMKLGEKLAIELPAILVKCNKAYLETVREFSHVNIWTILPRYFKDTRDQLARSVNSVEAFLAGTDVVYGEDLFCPMEDFRAALKTFEVSNNFKSKKYDADFFRGPFDKYGLRIERGKKPYRGTNKTRDYVMGIDLNVQQDDNDLG